MADGPRCVLLCICLVLGSLGATAAQAREEIFRDWRVICPSEADTAGCVVAPVDPDTVRPDGTFLRMVVEPGAEPEPLAIFATPLGTLVARPLLIDVDGGAPLRIGFRSCHAQGCFAPVVADADLIARMKRGLQLNAVALMEDGTQISRVVSLMGFTRAYCSVAAC